MQELGLQSVRTDAKKFYIKLQHRKKRNLLQRHFTSDRPNQVWSAISPILKSIIPESIYAPPSACSPARRVSYFASTRLVTTTFPKAYAERGNLTELTFHRDRGGQYISDTFSELLQNYHVKQSFSASGCPYDNAAAEPFFATFKKGEAYRREYTSERHFQKCVEEYIRFYNEVRPHQTLHYKAPQAFEAAHEGNYIGKPSSYSDLMKANSFTIFTFAQSPSKTKKLESLDNVRFPGKKPPVFRTFFEIWVAFKMGFAGKALPIWDRHNPGNFGMPGRSNSSGSQLSPAGEDGNTHCGTADTSGKKGMPLEAVWNGL